jgi:hypothetical protein
MALSGGLVMANLPTGKATNEGLSPMATGNRNYPTTEQTTL